MRPKKQDKDETLGSFIDEPPNPVEKLKTIEVLDEGSSTGGMTIVGEQKTGKGETRLFQTGIDRKEWLTKEEAANRGFYWAMEPPAAKQDREAREQAAKLRKQ